jgi:4-oxalomesaconate tautomerase
MLIRGGTSKGVFLLARDLPDDLSTRNDVLLRIMGSPDARQIDGLGGATTLTSKMAIISHSDREDCDVDYAFAQIGVGDPIVDTGPTCGNMLSGVGPFALLRQLVPTNDGTTTVRVWDVNTSSRMNVTVPTPGGVMKLDGAAAIDGVPGTAAPIITEFLDVLGPKTGNVLPTGSPRDTFDDVEVTCIDSVNPTVLLHATDLGETGHELPEQLDADHPMLVRLESIRQQASLAMGLGDARDKVLPKIALLSKATEGGHICSRYFTPAHCHEAHAVSGAIAIAIATQCEGTVASDISVHIDGDTRTVIIEHPTGHLDVTLRLHADGTPPDNIIGAGVVRTARPIMDGVVYL